MHERHKKFTETGRVLQQTRYGSASTTAEDVGTDLTIICAQPTEISELPTP